MLRSFNCILTILVESWSLEGMITLACEASVSVLFRSKGRAKNGASKRGVGGEERKETLADKPRDFENHPHRLSCLSGRANI